MDCAVPILARADKECLHMDWRARACACLREMESWGFCGGAGLSEVDVCVPQCVSAGRYALMENITVPWFVAEWG